MSANPPLNPELRARLLVGSEPGTRSGRLLDAMADRFDASALELDAGRLLD